MTELPCALYVVTGERGRLQANGLHPRYSSPATPEERDRNKMRVCATAHGTPEASARGVLTATPEGPAGVHRTWGWGPRLAVRLKEDDMGGGQPRAWRIRGCQIPPLSALSSLTGVFDPYKNFQVCTVRNLDLGKVSLPLTCNKYMKKSGVTHSSM